MTNPRDARKASQLPPNSTKDSDYGVHTDNYRYQLPIISGLPEYEGDTGGLPVGHIDQVIDRMMLRALFDIFYEFNETGFRKDYTERSRLIIATDEPVRFGEGYSELTRILENPIGNYVFPRNKTPKDLRITVKPDTEKRLKQYASEHFMSVSQAITEWIWNQKLKDEKSENE